MAEKVYLPTATVGVGVEMLQEYCSLPDNILKGLRIIINIIINYFRAC